MEKFLDALRYELKRLKLFQNEIDEIVAFYE